MIRYLLPLVFLIVTISPAAAESTEIKPGKYVSEGDTGLLTIQKNKKNELRFEIGSVGANCHSCSVSGVIIKGVGHADSEDADGKCLISFSAQKSTIVVEPTTMEECRYHCGARAYFGGSYTIPPATCTKTGRQAQRDRFLTLYRSRQYSQAASTLEALITQCREFMHWIEIDQVRSDLALSQYHNREVSQCLETLNATVAAKFENKEELETGKEGVDVFLGPCDVDSYIKTAKTIWFNKALCTKAKQEGK